MPNRTATSSSRAHPRSRGEHNIYVANIIKQLGSSPLARGTLLLNRLGISVQGLIPARAGNTPPPVPSLTPYGGSSPLARGTPRHLHRDCRPNGLIPARAGNTWSVRSGVCCIRAHPRSRGEHHRIARCICLWTGSSPLARGTLVRISESAPMSGLIPARAGNTKPGRLRRASCRAHPRSRGEHITCAEYEDLAMGSSPLARGTHESSWIFPHRMGLIPARAGNTLRY